MPMSTFIQWINALMQVMMMQSSTAKYTCSMYKSVSTGQPYSRVHGYCTVLSR